MDLIASYRYTISYHHAVLHEDDLVASYLLSCTACMAPVVRNLSSCTLSLRLRILLSIPSRLSMSCNVHLTCMQLRGVVQWQ